MWNLGWKQIKAIVELADRLLVENETTTELLEKYPSEEEYYNTILQLFKQTPDYINQFSVLSTSFDSGSSFKPDFIIDIPDLDKIQEVAMKKADEKYAPSFTYNDYAQDYDDINVDSRAAYEEGFFDGGKYMFDILNGTKVDNS